LAAASLPSSPARSSSAADPLDEPSRSSSLLVGEAAAAATRRGARPAPREAVRPCPDLSAAPASSPCCSTCSASLDQPSRSSSLLVGEAAAAATRRGARPAPREAVRPCPDLSAASSSSPRCSSCASSLDELSRSSPLLVGETAAAAGRG